MEHLSVAAALTSIKTSTERWHRPGRSGILRPWRAVVPDDLYDIDALAWSQREAAKLRRLAHGERINDLDWSHIIEEVEDVGLAQLRACRSLLRPALVHLLKLAGWPESTAAPHWRGELAGFLADARDAFAPSMRQRIDLAAIHRDALQQVRPEFIDGRPPRQLPDTSPFTLDEILADPPDVAALEAKLARPA
ncbi:MAG: DUF29 domain-containing protein [Alphaproteobacteria bacterium]|nr:DUF29 domain-containing protein [Alphaproteobacteria bacterium]